MDAFLENLKEEPLSTERSEIVDEIIAVLVNEKLQLGFYRSMMQRYQPKRDENQSNENNASKMSKQEERYLDSMKKAEKNHLLYGSQVFSLEEMNELQDAIKSSIFKKIKRVENEALVKIMNNYIQGVASEPKKVKEIKREKKP